MLESNRSFFSSRKRGDGKGSLMHEKPKDLSPERKAKLMPESTVIVEVTQSGIVVHRPEGTVEAMDFADLGAVIIETNDTGPWGIDVWWILVGKDLKGGCIYPGGATGEMEALHALQNLPGFDNEAVIHAASSCENSRFLCWEHHWQKAEAGP